MKRFQSILNAGSLAGLLSYGSFLILYYLLSINPTGPAKVVAFGCVGVLMYFTVKKYMEVELEGFATYRQLMRPAILFSFVYATLSGMLIYLHGAFVDANFVPFISEEMIKSMEPLKEGMIEFWSEAEFEAEIENNKNLTLYDVALRDAVSKSFSSIILGMIFALSMRKNPPIFDDSER
jgi:hypothetical protein